MDPGGRPTMNGSSPVISWIQVELDPDAPATGDEDDEDLEEEHLGYVADDEGDIGVGW